MSKVLFVLILIFVIQSCSFDNKVQVGTEDSSVHNELPTVVVAELQTVEGASEIIITSNLLISDSDNSDSELVITVESVPAEGILYNTRTSETLIVDSLFSYADITGNNIEYRHSGDLITDNGGSISDSFDFIVSDGDNILASQTINIEVKSFCFEKSGATIYNAYGAGTKDSPYQLCSVAQIEHLSANTIAWDSSYRLRANIDMTSVEPTPIGTLVNPFSGNFDGNNNTISNFTYDNSAQDYAGFFGYVSGVSPEIKDLKFDNADITGRDYTGTLVGFFKLGKIINIEVDGVVNGRDYTGGVIGLLRTSRVGYLKMVGSVSGTGNFIGGVIGASVYSKLENLIYRGGSISGILAIGGIIGNATRSSLRGGYSIGTVNGIDSVVGGIVGSSYRTVVKDMFSIGNVAGSSNLAYAGRVGSLLGVGGIDSNIFGSDQHICSDPGDGGPCNSRGTLVDTSLGFDYFYSKSSEPLLSWDFDNSWVEQSGDFPEFNVNYLSDDWGNCSDHLLDTTFAGGRGIISNPYLICTTTQLETLSLNSIYWDKNFLLMADLDLSSISNFTIIGDDTTFFTGAFDGNGYSISNIMINSSTVDGIGFFGRAAGGHFARLTLKSVDVVGVDIVGGLIGRGGLGNTDANFIYRCSVQGIIQGTNSVGGMVGRLSSSYILDSFTDVNVTGDSAVGGMVGSTDINMPITNSYAIGSVTGVDNVGGIMGIGRYSGTVISNSFSSIDIVGTGANIGTIFGLVTDSAIVTGSYYDAEKSCTGCDYILGTAVDTIAAPNYFYDKTSLPLSEWDFDNIWSEVTGDYPIN